MGWYTLKSVAPELLPQIAAMEALCFSVPIPEAVLRRQLENPHHSLFAAVDEQGQVLGYAGILQVLDEGYIDNIAVHPSVRRMGIGTALIQKLLEQRAAQNLSFLTLEVRESNVPARKLYENYGFVTVGIRKNYYEKPTENAILMTKFFRGNAGVE